MIYRRYIVSLIYTIGDNDSEMFMQLVCAWKIKYNILTKYSYDLLAQIILCLREFTFHFAPTRWLKLPLHMFGRKSPPRQYCTPLLSILFNLTHKRCSLRPFGSKSPDSVTIRLLTLSVTANVNKRCVPYNCCNDRWNFLLLTVCKYRNLLHTHY